jgi:hypothetical protein
MILCRFPAGLMVTERNWLDVFTYATWGGNVNLPNPSPPDVLHMY